jgi:hypothetical protein
MLSGAWRMLSGACRRRAPASAANEQGPHRNSRSVSWPSSVGSVPLKVISPRPLPVHQIGSYLSFAVPEAESREDAHIVPDTSGVCGTCAPTLEYPGRRYDSTLVRIHTPAAADRVQQGYHNDIDYPHMSLHSTLRSFAIADSTPDLVRDAARHGFVRLPQSFLV